MKKRLQQYVVFRWNRMLFAILAAVLFIVAYIGLYHVHGKQVLRTTEGGEMSGQMVTGYSDTVLLRQSFFIHGKCKLNKIYVRVASLEGVTVSGITVSVQTKLHETLVSQEVPVGRMQEGEYLEVELDGLALSGTDRYYLMLSAACPNGEADVVPGIHLCTKNHVNDILYLGQDSVDNQAVDAVYDYMTVRAGIHEVLVCLVILIVFLGLFLLKKPYIKYVPIVLVICAGLNIWYRLWREPLGVNLGNYDGAVMQRAVSVLLLLLCISGILCTVMRTKGKGFLERVQLRRADFCRRLAEKLHPHENLWAVGGGLLVMLPVFLAQLFIAQRLYQQNGFDVKYVYDMAKSLYTNHTLGESAGYLSLYPNNRALIMVFYMIIKLFGTTSDQAIYWHLVVLNILSVDAAIILLYQIARKLYSRLAAVFAFCFGLILFGFSGWLVVPYTDTMPMWIPMLLFWMYMKLGEVNRTYIRYILLAAMGALTVWGYYIKPQCVIVVIAFGIVEACRLACRILHLPGKEKKAHQRLKLLQRAVYPICGFGMGILVAALLFQPASKAISVGETDYSLSMPASHFLMMGAAENGSLGSWDYDSIMNYTQRYGTTEEKNAACWKRYSEMLDNYGFAGYMAHLLQKAQWVLGDGSFTWMGEGSFFITDFNADKLDETAHRYRELYCGGICGYDNTRKMIHFGRISAVWLLVLFLVLFPMRRARRGDCKAVLTLAAVGCIAFTMLFEGRPRYLILYLPFFCILAGASLSWFCGQRGGRDGDGM